MPWSIQLPLTLLSLKVPLGAASIWNTLARYNEEPCPNLAPEMIVFRCYVDTMFGPEHTTFLQGDKRLAAGGCEPPRGAGLQRMIIFMLVEVNPAC